MGIQANWFPSAPQDCTFLGQCKPPIALWTLPSDFIRFVFPCFSLFTIIFIYICPRVIFLLSARATNRLSLSREQGIRSGQHPARSVPSCFTRSPEPPWNSLPKDVQLPLRPPALLAFALAWEEALLCDCEQRRWGLCWVSTPWSCHCPVQQSPPQGLLLCPAGPWGYAWHGLWVIVANFSTNRFPISEASFGGFLSSQDRTDWDWIWAPLYIQTAVKLQTNINNTCLHLLCCVVIPEILKLVSEHFEPCFQRIWNASIKLQLLLNLSRRVSAPNGNCPKNYAWPF